MEFVSGGQERVAGEAGLSQPRRGFMFDLRTGKPLEIPERDQFGRCRSDTTLAKRVGKRQLV